jgi:hypothetical protein
VGSWANGFGLCRYVYDILAFLRLSCAKRKRRGLGERETNEQVPMLVIISEVSFKLERKCMQQLKRESSNTLEARKLGNLQHRTDLNWER